LKPTNTLCDEQRVQKAEAVPLHAMEALG
jgi:hypothetical protein